MDERPALFDYTKAEIIAGVFVLTGLAVLGYLSISIGGVHLLPRDVYRVSARFSNVGDLKPKAPAKIAGVTIGRVESIRLADFVAEAVIAIDRPIKVPKDTIASIATAGLLGDSYVSLSPGASEVDLRDGERIAQTEPALNMADLVGRAAFGTTSSPSSSAPAEPHAQPPEPKEPLR